MFRFSSEAYNQSTRRDPTSRPQGGAGVNLKVCTPPPPAYLGVCPTVACSPHRRPADGGGMYAFTHPITPPPSSGRTGLQTHHEVQRMGGGVETCMPSFALPPSSGREWGEELWFFECMYSTFASSPHPPICWTGLRRCLHPTPLDGCTRVQRMAAAFPFRVSLKAFSLHGILLYRLRPCSGIPSLRP